jgi:hypothetical protein
MDLGFVTPPPPPLQKCKSTPLDVIFLAPPSVAGDDPVDALRVGLGHHGGIGGHVVPHPLVRFVLGVLQQIVINKFYGNLRNNNCPSIFQTKYLCQVQGRNFCITSKLSSVERFLQRKIH